MVLGSTKAYISKLKLEGFALMSDMVYVTQLQSEKGIVPFAWNLVPPCHPSGNSVQVLLAQTTCCMFSIPSRTRPRGSAVGRSNHAGHLRDLPATRCHVNRDRAHRLREILLKERLAAISHEICDMLTC